MRAYSASGEEAVRASGLLKDWAGEGFLSKEQYDHLSRETICEFRRTNVFLRAVMFLFTTVIVVAVVLLLLSGGNPGAAPMLVFAAVAYAVAEGAVSQGLYRFGVEEALLVCSVVFLYVGLSSPSGTDALVPAAGMVASLWIWHRFGLAYAFLGAMLFVPWLAGEWTAAHWAQHVIVAAIYFGGLAAVVAVRSSYRSTYLNEGFSIAEALLWLGIYVSLNLQIWSADLFRSWWGFARSADEFSRTFYWATWVLTWCLPPVVLYRGLRERDRFVIAVGGITVILTLVTNKSYLGWERHTWDPMLLGAFLIGVALFLQRWLAQGRDGIRNGFTARPLSGKDKGWTNVASAGIGLTAPHVTAPHERGPDTHFGGGASGGGGASSDF